MKACLRRDPVGPSHLRYCRRNEQGMTVVFFLNLLRVIVLYMSWWVGCIFRKLSIFGAYPALVRVLVPYVLRAYALQLWQKRKRRKKLPARVFLLGSFRLGTVYHRIIIYGAMGTWICLLCYTFFAFFALRNCLFVCFQLFCFLYTFM